MVDIGKIDPNLAVPEFCENGLKFYNVRNAPFKLYGFYEPFVRMPKEVATRVNEGVAWLYKHTAGGRVRFATDSAKCAVRAKMTIYRMPHMPLTGSSGFDLYVSGVYKKTFKPPVNSEDGYGSVIDMATRERRELEINFPLYNDVDELYVGIDENAALERGIEYPDPLPIVYYGSSITQGGCASRPGNSYQALLGRWLNRDHINLGFSGSGRAEDTMIEYLAALKMRVFVMDYDHNAGSPEYLAATHEKLYLAVRAANPELPIIIVTRPDVDKNPAEAAAFMAVARRTYDNAIAAGDKRVWFIDGKELFEGRERGACTVDGSHPNDLGFMRMAERLYPVLMEALEL